MEEALRGKDMPLVSLISKGHLRKVYLLLHPGNKAPEVGLFLFLWGSSHDNIMTGRTNLLVATPCVCVHPARHHSLFHLHSGDQREETP